MLPYLKPEKKLKSFNNDKEGRGSGWMLESLFRNDLPKDQNKTKNRIGLVFNIKIELHFSFLVL